MAGADRHTISRRAFLLGGAAALAVPALLASSADIDMSRDLDIVDNMHIWATRLPALHVPLGVESVSVYGQGCGAVVRADDVAFVRTAQDIWCAPDTITLPPGDYRITTLPGRRQS